MQTLTVQIAPYRLESHDKFLINYTNIQLPNNVRSILSAGPNIRIPCRTKDIPVPTILKELEHYILNLNIITNFCNKKANGSNQYSSRSKDFLITKTFLNANADLFVMRSDKGGSTVVMRRDEYMTYITDILKDEES